MDKEEKELWLQEVSWRDQEIVRLEDQLFKAKKHIVDESTPSDYTTDQLHFQIEKIMIDYKTEFKKYDDAITDQMVEMEGYVQD